MMPTRHLPTGAAQAVALIITVAARKDTPMTMPTTYPNIPDQVRDALRDVYTDHGVELWWNARNTNLDGKAPRDLWDSDTAAVTAELERLSDG